MQYTALGHTGLRVSRLWPGTNSFVWSSDEKAAFEAGMDCFDIADVYSAWAEGNSGGESETIIGN
jgi:aryl-alcohol dehydrogenase-like predicted oxidoreductase